MIEISLGKIVLLTLIALIVLGPEKLPGAARTAGALLRRMRSGWDNVRAEVERELAVEDIKRAAREAAGHAQTFQSDVKSAAQQAQQPFTEAAAMLKPAATAPVMTPLPPAEDFSVFDEAELAVQGQLPLGEPVAGSSSAASPPVDSLANSSAESSANSPEVESTRAPAPAKELPHDHA